METRIQFRIDEETKRLAQQMAEKQGRTLSNACRELTEQLADAQRKSLAQDNWLTEQVNQAFAKLESDNASFLDHQTAKARMAKRKASIRNRDNQ